MMSPVSVNTFPLPEVNRREILRYAGTQAESPALTVLLDETLAEAMPILNGRVCWTQLPVTWEDGMLNLSFTRTASHALKRNLAGCHRIVVFAATIGLGIDRLITRYSRLSPARALLLQAIGTERIEALCDVFCDKIRREAECAGLHTVPRFSPGYGDFPLEIQQDLFRLLDCSRNIGLTLNESLLMSPSKSVTAIVGLDCTNRSAHTIGCSHCRKTDCLYRRMP